jgi:hypothetical protein
MNTAIAISAGPPSRLVQRCDLRQEAQKASVTATSVAADAPKAIAVRKMKISAGVTAA